MTEFAVLASPRDGEYASAIATVLKKLGAGVTVSDRLPQRGRPRVILVWSAALEELRRIDGPALVGLWSEGRLTTVLRDATPLPLGMRDLPSLPPGTPPRAVVDSLSRPDADSTGKPAAAAPQKTGVLARPIVAAALIAALGGGAYWYIAAEQRSRQAALTATLEAAAKASEELKRAKEAEIEAQKKLAEARAAELEATKQGDAAKARELEAGRKRAQAEASKQAEVVQEREAAALATRQQAKKAFDDAKGTVIEKTEIAAPKAEAPKDAVAKATPAPAPKAMTRSEREREEEERIARELAAKKSVQVAAVSPSVTAPAPGTAPATTPRSAPAPVAAVTPAPPVVEAPRAGPPPAVPAPEADQEPEWPKIVVALAVLALAVYGWRRSRKRAPQAATGSPAAAGPADGATLFVSYSHKDKARIEPIVSLIEQTGRRVWMDRTGITGQAGWAGQIVRAIRQSRAVVLMASPNSYASDQVVRELYLAMNHKKPIVPIEIEAAELPDELQYILAPYQHHRLSAGAPREVLGRALAAV